jgi:hypothetical protein
MRYAEANASYKIYCFPCQPDACSCRAVQCGLQATKAIISVSNRNPWYSTVRCIGMLRSYENREGNQCRLFNRNLLRY